MVDRGHTAIVFQGDCLKSTQLKTTVQKNNWDVIVLGAGAAGLMAAYQSADRGLQTLLLEKNRKLGVKILMSGGTRCNITQNTDAQGIVAAFGANGSFLHSALSKFGPRDIVDLLEELGVPTKIESTGKIFPVSDRAIHVRDALVCRLQSTTCEIRPGSAAIDVGFDESFRIETTAATFRCRNLVITTGGKSYPGCGTTGDGYAWAKSFGHQIVPPVAALAPIIGDEPWAKGLSGVTIEDVIAEIIDEQGSRLERSRASFLFTHFGFSGPAAMNVSRAIEMNRGRMLKLRVDFCPGENEENLWQRIWSHREESLSKQVGMILFPKLPRRLVEQILLRSGINPTARMGEVGKGKLREAVRRFKATDFSISATRGFDKAEVTAGGVALGEVNSSTMESKLQKGLFFAGEILDLDGPIGGYNFQSAFSTGWLAGLHVR